MTKCSDIFDIDEEELEDRAVEEESEYLDKCLDFWREKKGVPYAELSYKQKNWLEKIEESLQEPPRRY